MSRKISRRSFLSAAFALTAASAVSLTACADSAAAIPVGEPDDSILVVYFSHSSESNTRTMAQAVSRATGGELLELRAADAYAAGYGDSDRAQAERDENARPEIANLPENIDQYSTIIVGYPIWWHTAPMIIGTFLESFDLTGKEVYVFAQSASMNTEQFASSMEFVRECAPSANVHDGLFARPSDTAEIEAYLAQYGLA